MSQRINGAYRLRGKQKPFGTIECVCCGETIPKNGANQRVCKHKCEPMDDFEQTCARCGETKGYDGYYDYRYNVDGKLLTTCKDCIRTENRERYRRKIA